MAVFEVRFKVVDHESDDAGYGSFEEVTRVTSASRTDAWNEFFESMRGTNFEVSEFSEVK